MAYQRVRISNWRLLSTVISVDAVEMCNRLFHYFDIYRHNSISTFQEQTAGNSELKNKIKSKLIKEIPHLYNTASAFKAVRGSRYISAVKSNPLTCLSPTSVGIFVEAKELFASFFFLSLCPVDLGVGPMRRKPANISTWLDAAGLVMGAAVIGFFQIHTENRVERKLIREIYRVEVCVSPAKKETWLPNCCGSCCIG
jgi:hypothetical protein